MSDIAPTPPLAGVTVVDCSDLSPGPYATQTLADLGADVIIIERPRADTPDPDLSRLDSLRRGKRSIVVDLKRAGAADLVRRIAAAADVFVEGWRPGVADRLGLGFDALRELNPDLVYCSVTGYGQRGPNRMLAGHDLNYLALSGLLGVVSRNEDGPVPPLNVLADYAGGGLAAAFAVVVSLFGRERGHRSARLDVSMTDSIVSFLGPHISRSSLRDQYPAPGAHYLAGGEPCYRSYCCSDGKWISVAAIEDRFFDALCAGLGLDDLAGSAADEARRDEVARRFGAAFASDTRDGWVERLRDVTCVAPVLGLDELATDPGMKDRLLSVSTTTARAVQPDGPPGFPHRLATSPPLGPLRGADTAEILADAGYGPADIEQLIAAGAVCPPAPSPPASQARAQEPA